ncbi:E3 ubiquitin-protein ligase KCMF1 isoform X1 [Parasteatoda tepidariorum]|uniref:E3 ubiquitin-protein ligase KCMF1 isoform X1 n=1 Tax=Parasteatoda tepidariorum TaxID=114398 RepID=UPI00077FD488|nr:E3 ubiquitin-protein ligase KCMF1 isoform X1 [Parasteatoda tepidariorum]
MFDIIEIGVSCDSCLKGNFRGKRYKCLVCYDYDLCATCYEAGASTTRHNADHPMQCILTRSDFDLYYGGEAASVEHPQSFTCPFCGRMGLTESALTEHVSAEHSESSAEIVCPVCASQPGGEPNHMTDDFSAHLALDHRNRDIQDETISSRHVRRIPHAGRGMSSNRARRSQMQFTSAGGLASLSPNNRDSMDPIAELLSQLSSVRRSNLAQSNTTSQLQQLQMQLQLERQQAQMARQQLERLPRRQTVTTSISASAGAGGSSALQTHFTVSLDSSSPSSASSGPQFLLSRCTDPVITEGEQLAQEIEHAERSLFVQELLLNTLGEQFNNEELDSLVKVIDLNSNGEEANQYPDVNDNHGPRREPISAIAESGSHSVQSSNVEEIRQPRSKEEPPAQRPPQQGRIHNRGAGNSYNNPIGRGGTSQRANNRDALSSGGRPIGRTSNRERGTSPTRRKALRQVDDRNKTTEPPPPH